jgi:hypothetical protein
VPDTFFFTLPFMQVIEVVFTADFEGEGVAAAVADGFGDGACASTTGLFWVNFNKSLGVENSKFLAEKFIQPSSSLKLVVATFCSVPELRMLMVAFTGASVNP